MKDLISVIVPVYNVESYLNRCIESLVRQTYKYLEIILVDDGSLDGCPHICDKWSERDNRIHVIHKTNGGLSSARNAGLKVAKGEYIAFLDSDDWIHTKFIEHLYISQFIGFCHNSIREKFIFVITSSFELLTNQHIFMI